MASGRADAAPWATRLSAILLRGNAALQRHAGWAPPGPPCAVVPLAGALGHMVPEGDFAYELLVEPVHSLDEHGDV